MTQQLTVDNPTLNAVSVVAPNKMDTKQYKMAAKTTAPTKLPAATPGELLKAATAATVTTADLPTQIPSLPLPTSAAT